jgi:hypothetical protein
MGRRGSVKEAHLLGHVLWGWLPRLPLARTCVGRRRALQAHEWHGCVKLLSKDGICIDTAMANLRALPRGRTFVWSGELHAGISPATSPWPVNEPVLLRLADGRKLAVRLVPDVVECGPILMQIARVSQTDEPGSDAVDK